MSDATDKLIGTMGTVIVLGAASRMLSNAFPRRCSRKKRRKR